MPKMRGAIDGSAVSPALILRQFGDIRRDPSRLGQGLVALHTLQMRGHDRPSEGLWPMWRIEPDLKRDGDSG